MRENLSRRAWFVVLKSLLAAGRQGHDSIEANDLVTGIIAEDQDLHSRELDEQHFSVKRTRETKPQPKGVLFPPECWIALEPLLSAEIAASVSQGLKTELLGLDDAPGTNDCLPLLSSTAFLTQRSSYETSSTTARSSHCISSQRPFASPVRLLAS